MSELHGLKIKRGHQKAVLTRTLKFMGKLNNEIIDQKTKFELELRLKNLESAYKVFNEVQDHIELVEEADLSDTEREDFENSYFELCAQIRDILQNFKDSNSSRGSSGEHENVLEGSADQPQTFQNIQSVINPYVIPQVHLPLSSLPNYNGEYHKWVEFRDSFQALVDTNPIITNVQKLHYLRSCLSPSVLETIQSIPMTAANYKLAWETLKSRYERSQLIRQSHVKAILKLPRLGKESAKDLRRFCNELNNNLEALRNLNEPVDQWDLLLIPIVVERLDPNSQKEWEKYSTLHDSARVKDLLKVLNTRCDVLEKLENNSKQSIRYRQGPNQLVHLSHNVQPLANCFLCNENHQIFYCPKFLKLSPKQRFEQIKKVKRCFNCLNTHLLSQCISQFKCKKCGKNHNTLLHLEPVRDSAKQKLANAKENEFNAHAESREITHNMSNSITQEFSQTYCSQSQVFLSTAMVNVLDKFGNKHECRALLDNGAMSNFITKSLHKKLGLDALPMECTVIGIGQSTKFTNMNVTVVLQSRVHNFSKSINCLVLDQISSNIPCQNLPLKDLQLPIFSELADPEFNLSKPIDLLLGSSVFWELLQSNRIQVANTNLIMQDTKLGWIVGGSIEIPQVSKSARCSINCLSVEDNLENQIQKFWQIDVVPEFNPNIDSRDPGEQIYQKTVKRAEDGKFIVTIPFKDNLNQLGQSKILAKNKFYALEKRLSKNSHLKEQYSEFMNEYLKMKHMSPIPDSDSDDEELNYYIPHHCVCREESLTTKLRVVFNASMKTDSGLSLNDVQYPGSAIQNDLTILLLNFRIHPYVMTADISKMYRMIWINPDQTKFHRIFWRNDTSENLQCYELKTVTYGTASAPFLAIRCLHQLAIDNQDKYPDASKVIKNNFYVDDLVCGAQSEKELIKLQREVSSILQDAGFELRKWLANRDTLYNKFSINKQLDCSVLVFGEKDTNKTLGVAWNAKGDKIQFISTIKNIQNRITKRIILSQIAKIFDPLGLLGPFIVIGKLIMQDLWREKISWDDAVSLPLTNQWQVFKSDVDILNEIEIPRHVILPKATWIELHGFGDASEKAYGAAIYLVSKVKGNISSHLLCSRSRVAPLKQQSLPRLELCAAVLVAQLATKVINALEISINKCYFWTDSTITLSWLQACPTKWKTFVANRVAEVQRLTQISDWYHIASAENPADKLSRGCSIKELISCDLWWQGPSWLKQENYPLHNLSEIPNETNFETRHIATVNIQSLGDHILSKFSNLNTLKRVVAYCLRFSNNCKISKSSRKKGELEVEEIQKAMMILIAHEQQAYLSEDYKILQQNKSVKPNSPLSSLNPFIHTDGLIRVGGRLSHSSYSFNKKHPIVLPKHSKLTQLIFEHVHKKYFHCGPTQLLAAVREEYWPVSGKLWAKKIFQKCVICTKANPKPFSYQMGNLPQARVAQSIPFSYVGVDYAGPFQIKDRSTRNPKILKGYVCLFVCFATKALHLEVVSDLTTSCFLDALKRFISRRGRPVIIYSDNAKTFIGASAEMKGLHSFLEQNNDKIQKCLANDKIQWRFIPPRAPHFGGIWEAGVKSVKFHMKRIMKNYKFTYEEFSTTLCQIEAILNSRPLCPLSSNPDIEPLTPGHFLILRPPLSTPPSTSETPLTTDIKPSQNYKFIQQIIFQFWTRWRKEYIAELQRRRKWKTQADSTPTVKEGDVVILKDEAVVPMKWPLAKVLQLHPGQDGITRVATVKFENSIKKRPLIKLCPLPKE